MKTVIQQKLSAGCSGSIFAADQTAEKTAEIKRTFCVAGQELAESGEQVNQKLNKSVQCVHSYTPFLKILYDEAFFNVY